MSLKEKVTKVLNFRGAMVAALTPFDKAGQLNVSVIGGYLKYLTDNQVDGVYVAGTTGEGLSLTCQERIELAREWMSQIKKQNSRMLMIMNVTSTSLKEALECARECEKIGVDGIAVLPPLYYKATSVNQMVNYVKLIADSASKTPLLYYHIPSFTGELPFDLVEFVGTALKQVPQFCAMKFTDVNIVRYQSLIRNYRNQLKVFAGFEETLAATLLTEESNCAIGALFSEVGMGKAYQNMLSAYEKGDLKTVREEQKKLTAAPNVHRSSPNGFFYSIKATFNQKSGLDFGLPRAPVYYQ